MSTKNIVIQCDLRITVDDTISEKELVDALSYKDYPTQDQTSQFINSSLYSLNEDILMSSVKGAELVITDESQVAPV